jgi:putative membrane protein
MNNVTRLALSAGFAAALALPGPARAQSSSPDSASGGAGPSAGTGSTVEGAPSAGPKMNRNLQGDLEKLHEGNLGDLQAAQLGATHAQSPGVKQFAEQEQADHTQLDQTLTAAADALGVSLEGETFQKEQRAAQKDWQKVQSRTGADFDKAYMAQMVKDHEKDLKVAKDAVEHAQKEHQPELAVSLLGAQRKIQSHLFQAKHVQKSLEEGGGTASSGSSSSSAMGTGSSGSGSPSASHRQGTPSGQ